MRKKGRPCIGISVKPQHITEACRALDMFPCIEHVQIKLAPKRDERRKLEENVRLLKREHPDTELSFHAYGQANPAEPVQSVRREWLALIEDAVLQGQDMGGEFVVLHGGSVQGKNPVALRQNGLNTLCDSLEELSEFAQRHSAELHLENIYPAPLRSELVRFMDRAEDYRFMLDAVNAPGLKYCFDFGHAMIDDRGMPILYECMPKLGSVHIHENDRQNDLHMPPVGLFEWEGHIRAITDSGFDGPFIAETAPEGLMPCVTWLISLLEQAGAPRETL